jgi:hypothetical protein
MTALRLAAAVAGGAMLCSVASLAMAEPAEISNDDVVISVEIEALPDEGALVMTVAPGGVNLTEVTSADPMLREFTGQLPDVTVTDNRDVADIPDGAFWAVLAIATDFEGDAGQEDIPASYLGWTPRLTAATTTDSVTEGDRVKTAFDEPTNPNNPDNVGLAGANGLELLAMGIDSVEAREHSTDQWTATADMVLKVEKDVDPGIYTSTLTLSLFE